MIRHAAISGCNPSIYEVDIQEQWFAFEKNIYARRLAPGALREITQKIEEALLITIQRLRMDEFYLSWSSGDTLKVSEMISDTVRNAILDDCGYESEVLLQISPQTLNLRQFKYLSDSEIFDELPLHLEEEDSHSSMVFLEIELSKENGTPVRALKLEPGDLVFTIINDKRDIGVYLAHLLGGRKADEPVPLSATVEDVKYTAEGLEIFVRFGPMILGRCILDPREKIGVLKNRREIRAPILAGPLLIAIAGILLYYFLMLAAGF